MIEGFIDVQDAAKRLGVSARRVRQLLESGALGGERVAGAWLVSIADIERRLHRPTPAGQPLSAGAAWAVLARIEHRDEAWYEPGRLHPEERARVARYAQRGFDELAPLLGRRASVARQYVHPGLLAGLARDPEVREGGARAAAAYGAAVAENELRDIYVPDSAARLIGAVHAVASNEYNVVFHVVEDKHWPFGQDGTWVWPSVAVIDIYDQGGRGLTEALKIWRGER
jgi:excisionase family DNA binding protein